jgi:hypothetical protein
LDTVTVGFAPKEAADFSATISLVRKLSFIALVFTLTLTIAFVLYRRYRILPLTSEEQPHRTAVLTAANVECTQNDLNYVDRVIVLQTEGNLANVRINWDKLPTGALQERLTDILKTRADRTVYLVDNSSRDGQASLALQKMVEQVPVVDRICIIDPNHPPAWYPPKPDGAGGGGGTQLGASR